MKGNAIEPFQDDFNKNINSDISPDALTHNYSIIFLLNKIDALKEIYHQEKYVHENTVKNFLFYLERVKPVEYKQSIYEHLNQFLSKLESRHYSNPVEVVSLYKMHLEPIGKYYSEYFSFKAAKRETRFIFRLKTSKRRYGLFY